MDSNKVVHVNSYTKSDGTHVKEHYRGKGVSSFLPARNEAIIDPMENDKQVISEQPTLIKDPLVQMVAKILNVENWPDIPPYVPQTPKGPVYNASSNLVLEGGVSAGHVDFSNILSAIVSIASIAVDVVLVAAPIALEISAAIAKNNQQQAAKLKSKLGSHLTKIQQNQSLADKLEKESIKKLADAKNQEEYSNLYQTLQEQRELNSKNRYSINKINYAVEHNDYHTVFDELKNYQNNNNVVGKKIQTFGKNVSSSINQKMYDIKRTGLHKYPKFEKHIITAGMSMYKYFKGYNNANELWKLAANGFDSSNDYINKNGYMVESTSKLNPKLRSFVSNKLMEQIGTGDSKGVVFRPDSSLAKDVIQSSEFKTFVKTNLTPLLKGQVINSGINFEGKTDTHYSLGHTDVLNAHIDANGTLTALVIDTYDFNKNDPSWEVEWARNVQEHGLLTNYFSITVIVLPLDELLGVL